jgi:hypothetical protein
MPYASGKISAPVSISDIQQCIWVQLQRTVSGQIQTIYSADIGMLIGAFVGQTISASDGLGSWTVVARGTINMWAKYKPVVLNEKDTVTGQWDFANNKWKTTATWWKGANASAIGGIVPKSVIGLNNLPAEYTNDSDHLNGWVYNKPTGGALSPYRQTDFAVYNHNAPKAIENFYIAPKINREGRFSASAIMSMPAADADYITLEDFSSDAFNTLYWGVVFWQNGEAKARCTADTPGVAMIDATFSGNILPAGYYYVYPFFANQQLSIGDSQSVTGVKFYTCPHCERIQVQLVNPSDMIDATIDAKYMNSAMTSIQIVINGDSQRTFTNNYWYILPATYWNDPAAAIAASQIIDSGSIATLSINQQVTVLKTVAAGNYFVYATFQSGAYNKKSNIVSPPLPQNQ